MEFKVKIKWNCKLILIKNYLNIFFKLPANCTGNEFLCLLDNACIPLFKRCNGRADCDDQSDEKECGE